MPYSIPVMHSSSNGNRNGTRGVPGHAPQPHSPPHPQPPPLTAAQAAPANYPSAAVQYAPYPALHDPTTAQALDATFSPTTTSGTQSRSGSIAGGMHSGASSSSGGGAAGQALPIDMTVNFTVDQPPSGGLGQNISKRARSDDTGSSLSRGGTPRGLTDKVIIGSVPLYRPFADLASDSQACKTCRVRKVKVRRFAAPNLPALELALTTSYPTQCDRRWPKCQRCKDRGEECDFGSMVPGERAHYPVRK